MRWDENTSSSFFSPPGSVRGQKFPLSDFLACWRVSVLVPVGSEELTFAQTTYDYYSNSNIKHGLHIHLVELCPITTWTVVEHGIEDDNAHNVLVEVETQLVEFTRPSVENQGLEIDWSKVNKVHELALDLVGGQLAQL